MIERVICMKEPVLNQECPCKRVNCKIHGDCKACREHHGHMKRNLRVACDRLADKRSEKMKRGTQNYQEEPEKDMV